MARGALPLQPRQPRTTPALPPSLLLTGRSDLVASVRAMHSVLGGTIDPHAAYLLLRGMKTLGLRVAQQNKSALELARRLESHPKICAVHYPGLPSHPDHAIAVAQMSGFGGVVSFEVDGDLWRTAAFIDAVRLPYIAPSLGGVESLIEQPTVVRFARAPGTGGAGRPACTSPRSHPRPSPCQPLLSPPPRPPHTHTHSYWDQGAAKRAAVGIKDNLVRFSTGIEDVEDIWSDFEQALDQI